MGRRKSKPRAQRKFAQGAPRTHPQNQPSSVSTILPARAIHRAVNKPGPVTHNNCTAKDMLTVMSLGKVHPHINLHPIVKLEYDPELALKAESTEKESIKIEKTKGSSLKKKKYELRKRIKLKMRHDSDSDSGEDKPLSYLKGDGKFRSMKTRAAIARKAQGDQQAPALAGPSSAVDTATVSHTQNSSAISESRLPTKPKKPTRPAKRKIVSTVAVANNMAKKIRTRRVARRKRLRSAMKSAAEPDSVNNDVDIKQEPDSVGNENKGRPYHEAKIQELARIIVAQIRNTNSNKSEETDPEMPVNTTPDNLLATTSASCSTAHDSTPFKLPSGLVTRTQSNRNMCASQFQLCLQDMLLGTPTSGSYCSACKRCELLTKYKKVLSMLPVSEANEPDILAPSARDVYDFDSDEDGLKFLRRGRELVRNVLTTGRFFFWLCNLEMTLKKTMFFDAHKLKTLQRNIQLGKDDVTVNKIISRIDYLNQCLMEDKKELDSLKTKRKKKVTKSVVAVASKSALKKAKEPDEPELLHDPKRARKEMRTSLDSDNIRENIIKTTEINVPSSPPVSLSSSSSGSNSPRASTSLQDTDFLTAPVKKVTFPLVSPLTDAPIITIQLNDDDSSQEVLVITDQSDEDDNGSPSNDSTPLNPFSNPRVSDRYAWLADLDKELSEKITTELRYCAESFKNTSTDPDRINLFKKPDRPIPSTSRAYTADSDIIDLNSVDASPIFVRTPVRPPPSPFTNAQLLGYTYLDELDDKVISVEDLIYRPTPEEFMDPIKYIQKIRSTASKYGICKIIPPKEFHVPCHLDDNSMFTTDNQYLGRLYQRWGQTSRELTGIQTYVAKLANPRERDQFTKCPIFDGVELDLVKLYDVVLEHGGIEELLAHGERWSRVAEQMNLVSPRGKPDLKKLEKLYCKHVLPYESLTPYDREKLLRKVDRLWRERYRWLCRRALRPLYYQKRMLGECDSDDDLPILAADCEDLRLVGKPCFDRIEECIAKGRTMNLATYRRLSAQIRAMRLQPGPKPTTEEIEESYWRILSLGSEHVCVLSACIDTAVDNLGHTSSEHEPGGNHPWNLKRLGENPENVLSYLGKTLCVTNPTLSLNQLYSTSCWHKDPHLLAWMDYMHQGSTKIWYAVSDNDSPLFRKAIEHLSPSAVQNKGIWLSSDTTMVPPALLLAKDVKLRRIEQNPGEFIVVFPGAYASSIATGLTISESIYFENKEWLNNIDQIFQEMRNDYEPGMFSNIVLLFRMARDPLVTMDMLPTILKSIEGIITSEVATRKEAERLKCNITLVKPEGNRGPVSWPNQEECSICRAPLILSKTCRFNDHRLLMCLKHGVQLYKCASDDERGDTPPVIILYTEEELMEILNFVQRRADGEDVMDLNGELYQGPESTVTVKVERLRGDCNDDLPEEDF